MDIHQKKSILTQLARKGGEQATQALEKEADKIQATLMEDTRYDVIDSQMDLLESFALRVPQKAFAIAEGILNRLGSMDLTHSDMAGFSNERLREFFSKERLIVKIIGFMSKVFWPDPEVNEKCFRIFLDYIGHENESVRKEAKAKIETIAEYHLHLYRMPIGDNKAFGLRPQFVILKVLEGLNDAELKKYSEGVCAACKEMLSPTMEGTDQTYNQLVFQTAALPASESVCDLRERTIQILQKLYRLADSTKDKEKAINTLSAAFERPRTTKVEDNIQDMISGNIRSVLEFLLKIIASEKDLMVVQKIEHIAYLRHYHAQNEEVKTVALAIKDFLGDQDDYQTFKALVGYQGVFRDWRHHSDEKEGTISDTLKEEEKRRNSELQRLLNSITDETKNKWENRILEYAAIQSNDGATFPFFMRFLEGLGERHPDFALDLLIRHAEGLKGFIPYILWNLYKSEKKEEARKLTSEWIMAGHFLREVAFVFGKAFSFDDKLFKKLCAEAIKQGDLGALSQIAMALVANYSSDQKSMVGEILSGVINKFSENKNADWVMVVWYQKELRQLVKDASEELVDAFLENLLYLERVGHEIESFLAFIAERYPEKILAFFGKRIKSKRESELGSGYDAFPYEFYKLDKAFSLSPQRAVEIVREWYDGDYSLFIYRGAKFLSLLYPDFPEPYEGKLIELVQSGDEKDRFFVLAILRNYDGNPKIHGVCKELVKVLPVDSREHNELSLVLQAEGVVEGDYGFVKAYQRKKEEIHPWLSDEDDRVRSFAKQYTAELDEMISRSQKRAEEDIELRKFKYGSGENEDN